VRRLLKVEGIDVHYGIIPAVRQLSLRVEEGQIVALVGANGAGKTTTLKTIAGVLQPKKGRVIYNSEDVTELPSDKRVRIGITLIPEGRQIFSGLSVKENLLLGAYYRKNKDEIKKDVDWIRGLFSVLIERQSQIAGTLSGGEQQMLALGRGLMSRPKLLLLDEPSLGLAPMITKDVYQAIQKINEAGITILLVEQNINIAMKVADYAYVMETGSLKLQGKPEAIMRSEDIRRAYLGD